MFWTLVVMTIGGAPIPTDLVFDSIDACYEAEEQMVSERSRYATEWMARSSDKRAMPDFLRQNLMRGVCIPHVATNRIDNLPKGKLKGKLKADPDRLYQLTEQPRRDLKPAAATPALQAFITPRLDYNLPKIQMTFRLIVRNPSDNAVQVRNPLQNFFLTFQRPDGYPVDAPTRMGDLLVDRVDISADYILRGPSLVEFRTAIVNGREDAKERNTYSIDTKSSLEIVFQCEKAVSESILAALEEVDPEKFEKYVDVSVLMSLMYPDSRNATMMQLEEKIRLPVPNP